MQAAMLVGSERSSPWYPFTIATPIRASRYGSSPEPSATLPHLGSRAMSSIGENVHLIPAADASTAAIRAPCSAMAGLNVAAWPSGIGKIVLNPWITSRLTMTGMPRRLLSTAAFCTALISSASTQLSMEPTLPAATSSMVL